MLADVFNAKVYVQDVANSASLGGAYRAKHLLQAGTFQEAVQQAPPMRCVATPNAQAVEVNIVVLLVIIVFQFILYFN